MMLREFLTQYVGLFIVIFLVTAMFSLGLDLTVRQIIEPLKNKRLVSMSLLTNAIAVPLLAFALTSVIPMHEGFRIGIILYALAAGTEGGPKFVQIVKGNAAFALGLLVLLLTFTVVCLPIVLSFAVGDFDFPRGQLVIKLLVLVALPIGLGLLLNAKAKSVADKLNPIMHRLSMLFLWTVFFILIYVYYGDIIALEGGALLAGLAFFVLAFLAGYFSGGPEWQNRRALGIMTFARNGSIAMMIARDVFTDEPKVLVMATVLAAGSVIGAVLIVVVMGRSVPEAESASA
jgi:BASS family bile acid:Na+ symporter